MRIILLFIFAFSAVAALAESSGTLSTATETQAPPAAPKWNFGYSYYHYSMEGTSTANTKIYKFGDASVDMQLYTLTWTPNSTWTVMALVPYIRNRVETIYEPIQGGLNLALTDETEGLSDVRFMAMRPLVASATYLSLVDFGFTAPTGKTDATFNSAPNQNASYNMQLGSGTPDLIVGITGMHFTTPKWTQNIHAGYTRRLGRNSHGWALGDEINASASSKYQLIKWINAGVQFNYKNRDKVKGRDNEYELFNNYQNGQAQGDGHQYYHQSQINYDLTAMVKAEYKTALISPAVEVGVPLWQDADNADNIRLDTRYYIVGSASAAF